DVVVGDRRGEVGLAGAAAAVEEDPGGARALRVARVLHRQGARGRDVAVDAGVEVLEGLVLERAEVADAQQLLVLAPLLLAHAALAGDQAPEVGVGDRHLEAHVAGVEADRALRRGLRRGPVASAGTFRDRTFQILEDVRDAAHLCPALRSPTSPGWPGCSASSACCS